MVDVKIDVYIHREKCSTDLKKINLIRGLGIIFLFLVCLRMNVFQNKYFTLYLLHRYMFSLLVNALYSIDTYVYTKYIYVMYIQNGTRTLPSYFLGGTNMAAVH